MAKQKVTTKTFARGTQAVKQFSAGKGKTTERVTADYGKWSGGERSK